MHDGRLFAVRPDGDGLTQINLQTGTQQYFAFEPRWSPDGTRIQWPGGHLHREAGRLLEVILVLTDNGFIAVSRTPFWLASG